MEAGSQRPRNGRIGSLILVWTKRSYWTRGRARSDLYFRTWSLQAVPRLTGSTQESREARVEWLRWSSWTTPLAFTVLIHAGPTEVSVREDGEEVAGFGFRELYLAGPQTGPEYLNSAFPKKGQTELWKIMKSYKHKYQRDNEWRVICLPTNPPMFSIQ